jgi:hypothetical protein
MHTKNKNLRTAFPSPGAVRRFEGNVADSTKLGTSLRLSLDLDLRVTFKVVVEFLSGMPVTIKRSVRWNLDEVHKDVPVRRELHA